MAEAKVYTRIKLDTAEFAKKLKLTEEQMKTYTREMERMGIQGGKEWAKMEARLKKGALAKGIASEVAKTTLSLAGLGAGLTGVTSVMGDAVRTSMDFERSLSGLSALTGATGEDLEFIRRQAIALSSQSELSARDVVEAMKLIGGQRPELLEAADGLATVTKATITLAEASETPIEDSARALTGALGQFGKGAEYAATFVNVLAAGAKEGAAEIPYLQQAVEKSGSAASSAGLSFEQLVAVIEGVAPRFTRAEEAGTSLRAVFTILESQTNDKLKPSVVGIHDALDNLAAQEMTTAQLTKMFGRENINMARALLDARGNIRQLEGAVTGTHVAEEQARVTTDNLAGAVKELGNAWDAFILSLNRSDGALAGTVRWLTSLIDNVRKLSEDTKSMRTNNVEKQGSKEVESVNARLVSLQGKGLSRADALAKLAREYRDAANYEAKTYNKFVKQINTLVGKRNAGTINRDEDFALTAWLGYQRASDATARRSWGKLVNKRFAAIGSDLNVASFEAAYLNGGALKRALSYIKQLQSQTPAKTDGGGGGGKDLNTVATDAKREQEARQRALDKLGDAVERARAKQAEGEVAAMQEGHAKRLAEIRLEWRTELAEIDKQQAEAAKAAKDAGLGGLTPEQTAVFDALREQANAKSLQATREELAAERQARLRAYAQMLADREAYLAQQAEQEQQLRETLRGSLEGALGGVTGLLGQVDAGWAQTVTRFISGGMQVVQSVLQIIQSIQTLTQTLQTMRAVSSIGSMLSPVTGLLGGGGVFGAILQRGGVVDGYAGGGVFKGGRTTGDHVLARVNAGEMVLTRTDQSRLLASMRSGGATGGGTTTVRGEDIYLALTAYMGRTGKRI